MPNSLKNTDLFSSITASSVRALLLLLFGLFGYEPTAEALGQAVAAFTTAILLVMSLLWSHMENRKLIKRPPPRPGEPGY